MYIYIHTMWLNIFGVFLYLWAARDCFLMFFVCIVDTIYIYIYIYTSFTVSLFVHFHVCIDVQWWTLWTLPCEVSSMSIFLRLSSGSVPTSADWMKQSIKFWSQRLHVTEPMGFKQKFNKTSLWFKMSHFRFWLKHRLMLADKSRMYWLVQQTGFRRQRLPPLWLSSHWGIDAWIHAPKDEINM